MLRDTVPTDCSIFECLVAQGPKLFGRRKFSSISSWGIVREVHMWCFIAWVLPDRECLVTR